MASQVKRPVSPERRERRRATLWGATEAEFEQHKAVHRQLLAIRTIVPSDLAAALDLTDDDVEHLAQFAAW